MPADQPSSFSKPSTPAADLALIDAMAARGTRAAAQHGRQLVWWGASAAALLLAQFVAEVRDWAPSRVLWWWQPPLLVAAAISLRSAFRFPGGRLRNSVIARVYVAGFFAAFVALVAYLMGSGLTTGHPVPYTTVLVLAAILGAALTTVGAAAGFRPLLVAGIGWWCLLIWFAARGRLVPTDFLVLSVAMILFLAAPGLALRPHRAMPRRPEEPGDHRSE